MRNPDIPDIINTPVIPVLTDVFWDDRYFEENISDPRPILVATTVINSDEERDLLQKILDACQLPADSYHIFQLEESKKIAWHLLRDKLGLHSIILFGIEPQQLGVSVHMMPHQTNRFNNCNWIVTSPLSQILKQPEIKGHLWNYGLKPVFIDKIYG